MSTVKTVSQTVKQIMEIERFRRKRINLEQLKMSSDAITIKIAREPCKSYSNKNSLLFCILMVNTARHKRF
jgi:hypothetical protein